MPPYRDTLRFLYGLQLQGIKLGLRNTRELLRVLGNPHKVFPCIHVAGSNGKGSTSAFLASILMEAGFRTGLYTSPHLVRFTERIRVDGKEIPEPRLVEYASMIRGHVERTRATFFEATTAIMFRYFADEEVDVAVIETGLGGRFDATNVVIPLVSVITNVSLEHTEYLGSTVAAIAKEKAGIIKRGVPIVTAAEDGDVLSVLAKAAAGKGSSLVYAHQLVSVRQKVGQDSVDIRMGRSHSLHSHLGLAGRHQWRNAALALAALRAMSGSAPGRTIMKRVDRKALLRGLSRVVRNTGLRGRMENIYKRGRLYILDVAHNPEGLRTLAASLLARRQRPKVLVFGVLRDKDVEPMLRSASEAADILVAVTPETPRALRSRSLAAKARKVRIPIVDAGSVKHGLAVADKLAGKGGEILVAGSHYVVGPVLEMLEEEKA